MTIRDIGIMLGYEIDKNTEQKAENSIKSLKSMATKMLGTIGIGFSLVQLSHLSEEFSRVNDQIQSSTEAMKDQDDVQKKILASANATRTAYADSANVISKLMRENEELFGTVDEAVSFNNAATMLFKTAGKTNDQIAGLMESINKSFAKGRIDTETISQLLEQSPEAVALLNRRLGTTTDQLEQLATDGKISLADLKDAFVDNADEIAKSFEGVRYNVTDALLNIRNQWGFWVADMDESLKISETIGTVMVKAFSAGMNVLRRFQTRVEWLSEKLGGVENLLRLIGIIAGSAFGVMALPKLLAFLDGIRKIDKAMLGVKLKMLGIIAVIVILALLIEDFMAFLRGDNSLIGSLFDKAGIGAENARKAVFKAWGAIRDFLLKAWGFIQAAAEEIFGPMAEWWAENGEEIADSFRKVWKDIQTLCILVWRAISAIAKQVFGNLKKFWDTWGVTIMAYFGTLWKTMAALIKPFLDALSALIKFVNSVFTGDWKGAFQAIRDFTAAICEMIIIILRGAWDAIQIVWSKLGEVFGGIFQTAWTAIKEKVYGIKNSIVNGFQEAINWIRSLPEEALRWGADIIQGIVDGITGAVGKIGEAAAGVADKIKSFLGFSEPEDGPLSDFHTYMPDMVDLMAKGIQSGKDKVKKAVADLTQGMSVSVKNETGNEPNNDDKNFPIFPQPKGPAQSAFPASVGDVIGAFAKTMSNGLNKAKNFLDAAAENMGVLAKTQVVSAGTAAIAGNSSISKSIVQNIQISNQFNGNRAGQQKSSEAMEKASSDATSEMARALAFTR